MSLFPLPGDNFSERTRDLKEVSCSPKGHKKTKKRITPGSPEKEKSNDKDQKYGSDEEENNSQDPLELLDSKSVDIGENENITNGKLRKNLQEVNAMVGIGNLFSGKTFRLLKTGLNGSSMAQEVIANNLANVNTPGYHAMQAKFKENLAGRIENQEIEQACLSVSSPLHLNGEPVESQSDGTSAVITNTDEAPELDRELSKMTENAMYYYALSQLISGKYGLLKNVISEGRNR